MTKRRAAECPDLETIAAYIDGTLPKRERARVTEHIASCEECYTLFVESAQTPALEAIAPSPARGWLRAERFRLLGGAAAVLATAASLWLVVGGTLLNRSSDLQMLVAAVAADHAVEGRLTGGFAYGPLRGVVRAGEPSAATVAPDVRIAAARIEKDAAARRTPQTLHALGVSCPPARRRQSRGADARGIGRRVGAERARAERSLRGVPGARRAQQSTAGLRARPDDSGTCDAGGSASRRGVVQPRVRARAPVARRSGAAGLAGLPEGRFDVRLGRRGATPSADAHRILVERARRRSARDRCGGGEKGSPAPDARRGSCERRPTQ